LKQDVTLDLQSENFKNQTDQGILEFTDLRIVLLCSFGRVGVGSFALAGHAA
jgi:hypothetical protein